MSETTATIRPAAAVVAAIGSTPRAPATSASQISRGPIQSRRSRNENRNAMTVAMITARNALNPVASRTTIRISEEK